MTSKAATATSSEVRPSRRRPERRQELLDAALRVIRASGPPVSMDAIANEAGITRPVLYRFFGDVGGVYEAVAEHFANGLLAHIAAAGLDKLSGAELVRGQIDVYLAYIESEPNLYRFLTRQFPAEQADGQAAVAGFVGTLASQVADFLRDAGLSAITADIAGRAFVGALQTTGEWWLDHPTIARRELADRLSEFLWSGFSRLS